MLGISGNCITIALFLLTGETSGNSSLTVRDITTCRLLLNVEVVDCCNTVEEAVEVLVEEEGSGLALEPDMSLGELEFGRVARKSSSVICI